MASFIRVKRSTGTAAPSTIKFGELALTVGLATHGTFGGRLFGGDNTTPDPDPIEIGGKYYTDLIRYNLPGSVAAGRNADAGTLANGFIPIMNRESAGNPGGAGVISNLPRVDQWSVDDLTFDGHVISSNIDNTDIIVRPNGTGEVLIEDDNYLTFGTSKDAKIKYDEAGSDTLQISGADWNFITTTDSNSKNDGSVILEGGAGIEKNLNVGGNFSVGGISTFTGITTFASDLYVGGDLYVADDLVFDEFNARNTNLTGIATFQGRIDHLALFNNQGGAIIDNVGISSNVISTRSGGGNTLYIDPYPDGLSNEGTVIVKGDLQVDGTTTTVNSTSATVNDAIMTVGDVTSQRTVMKNVGSGTSIFEFDSVVGINTGDTLTAVGMPGAGTTTVYSYISPASGVGLGTVYIDGVTTAGINTTAQLTITHGFDTNTDRGISFNYNTSSGVGNNKTGFFGYEDSSNKFTFVPDATITGSVVSGTKGFLDIKGIYYNDAADWDTSGVVYFDNTGLQKSTVSPAAGISTSNYVLTTNAAGTPTWTTTLDGGTF